MFIFPFENQTSFWFQLLRDPCHISDAWQHFAAWSSTVTQKHLTTWTGSSLELHWKMDPRKLPAKFTGSSKTFLAALTQKYLLVTVTLRQQLDFLISLTRSDFKAIQFFVLESNDILSQLFVCYTLCILSSSLKSQKHVLWKLHILF